MNTRTINEHIEDLHIAGGIVYVNGHVEDLHMNGGVIYNYGRVDDLHQNGGIRYDKGKQHAQASIIYRDREKIVYRNDDATANHLRDLLEAAMEVNRRQAARIKELEQIISEHREAEIEDPWDIEPTKADCKRLLKQLDLFTDK